MTTVAVIGGGISGLSCALNIADQRPDIDVIVLEASDRLGLSEGRGITVPLARDVLGQLHANLQMTEED